MTSEIEDIALVRKCLSNGAVSYLLKKNVDFYLPMAIAITHSGGSFISPTISRRFYRRELTGTLGIERAFGKGVSGGTGAFGRLQFCSALECQPGAG